MFHNTLASSFRADIVPMKYLIYLLCSISLLAQSGFEKKSTKENVEAMENEKIKCRWVCDKKLYREQKIAEAISFYKNSKEYSFSNKKSQ